MKISIITPAYNSKHFMPETLKSVMATVLAPLQDVSWEYIVYDDGSTDGLQDIFKGLSDSRIRFIRNDQNQGRTKARNAAIMEATGEYLFSLDHDDILLSRTLYNFARKAKEFPEADWFIADFLNVDKDLRYRIGEDYYGWDFENPKAMLEAIFKGEHFLQHSFLVKRQLVLDVGMYDPDLKMTADDMDLCVRFLLKGSMPVRCDFISHLHRFHDSNMSNGMTNDIHKQNMLELKKKYADLTRLV